jgi:arylsulfatase A-like enzyme
VVETLDILPTLQELFSIPSPAAFQGTSMVPLLQGETSGWMGVSFSENTPCGYQCARIPEKTSHRIHAVRSGPWKLIAAFSPQTTRFELFNLSSDPEEKQNLINTRPEIAARLKDLLLVQSYKNRLLHKQILQHCSDNSK